MNSAERLANVEPAAGAEGGQQPAGPAANSGGGIYTFYGPEGIGPGTAPTGPLGPTVLTYGFREIQPRGVLASRHRRRRCRHHRHLHRHLHRLPRHHLLLCHHRRLLRHRLPLRRRRRRRRK